MLRQLLNLNLPKGITEVCVYTLGVPKENPRSQWEATATIRCHVRGLTKEAVEEFDLCHRLESYYLDIFPGYYRDDFSEIWAPAHPQICYWPGLTPNENIKLGMGFVNGQSFDIDHAEITDMSVTIQPKSEPATPLSVAYDGETVMAPLGMIAFARSEDKGRDNNCGIYAIHSEAWPWLRANLTIETLREKMSELTGLEIRRNEFPNLEAVHFVFYGYLGDGNVSNTRVDPLGKAVGEYIRALIFPIPKQLLPADFQANLKS